MMPAGLSEALEIFYMIAVPALFWIGLVAAAVINASSSSPYFLGTRFFTRLYLGVVALFVVNLVHRFLGLAYFLSMNFENSIIIAGLGLFFWMWSASDEAEKLKRVAEDPKAQICPKCKVILDRIFRVCPKCDAPLDETPPSGPAHPSHKSSDR